MNDACKMTDAFRSGLIRQNDNDDSSMTYENDVFLIFSFLLSRQKK